MALINETSHRYRRVPTFTREEIERSTHEGFRAHVHLLGQKLNPEYTASYNMADQTWQINLAPTPKKEEKQTMPKDIQDGWKYDLQDEYTRGAAEYVTGDARDGSEDGVRIDLRGPMTFSKSRWETFKAAVDDMFDANADGE